MRKLSLRLLLTSLLAVAIFVPVAEAKDMESLLHSMTIEEKIGQMLLPAFRTQAAQGVISVTPEVAHAVSRYRVGGVILFRENLVSPAQTVKLISDLQAASPRIPLFVGVDQEGGRVTRLPYGTAMPGNMALAASGKAENAYLSAKAIGEELRELGFNLNFAPVLDINSNPDNPVIGVRSFGEEPATVATMGDATIRGLHAAGVAAAVKHFPGHGDTSTDSHLGLPTLAHSLNQLESRELKPFLTILHKDPDMIMTAHIALPTIEHSTAVSAKDRSVIPLPATLSSAILTGLLRQKLNYDGVIITDALNMKAIAEHFGPGEAAVRAIQAGADILLMPDLEKSHSALLAAVQRGDIAPERIDQSVRRILAVKEKQELFSKGRAKEQLMAKKERSGLEARLAEQAVTLLKNQDHILPFSLRAGASLLLIAPKPDQLSALRQQAEEIYKLAGLPVRITGLEYQTEVTGVHQSALANADQIIIATDSADAVSRNPARSPIAATAAALVSQAVKSGKPVAVIATRNPYDIMYLDDAPAYLAVYAPIQPNIAAGVRAILGQSQPQGKLPVTIPTKNGGVLYPRGFGLGY